MSPYNKYPLVLGSKSPRRKYLMEQAGFQFRMITKDVEEVFPDELPVREVAPYLAQLKAEAILPEVGKEELVITADTVVLLDNKIYGKPNDIIDAKRILGELSGKVHEVITGVCLMSTSKTEGFSETTKVHFAALSEAEIDWYVHHYEVMDKAGAYGIQDGIGLIGIERIDGCYFNVMGLPVHRLYQALLNF
ncbi:MAG: Maf family protein [Chitinophagales bacterium]|nr:Maf family protein [Chitinophagales bacterium]